MATYFTRLKARVGRRAAAAARPAEDSLIGPVDDAAVQPSPRKLPERENLSIRELVDDLESVFPIAAEAIQRFLEPRSGGWVTVATAGGDLAKPLVVSYLATLSGLAMPGDSNFQESAGFGAPYLDDSGAYHAIGSDPSAIPLVFHRYFESAPSSAQDSLELAEDFRLFWNLAHDLKTGEHVHFDETGDRQVVARVTRESVTILGPWLRRYLAARQLALVRQFTVDARTGGGPESWNGRHACAQGSNTFFEAWGSVAGTPYIRCQGIMIELPAEQRSCGVWPFESDREHLDFVVDVDEFGTQVLASSDATYVDDGKDFFLTPVFFQRSVLDRYLDDPDRYRVEDGHIWGPSWTLPIDNGRSDDVVLVFLGDLGRGLPVKELYHWRAHNIEPDELGLSDTALQRSFLATFAESSRVEHRFRSAYFDLNQAWTRRFGWPLYKEPHPDDHHVLTSLQVPTNQSMKAFDEQIVLLAKATVDFLNESELADALETKPRETGGINKLEALLQQSGITDGLTPVLRKVQGARTKSGAHRKGETFDRNTLLDGYADLPALFAGRASELSDEMSALAGQLQ